MNVLAAMAGITDGDYCKGFTEDYVDIITIGGFNTDLESFKAGLENSLGDRQEFLTCPHHLSEDVSENISIIRNFNPEWSGKVMVNLRGVKNESFKILKDNCDVDIIEINAHCRQPATVESGGGQALLHDTGRLSSIIDEVVSSYDCDVCVKIRATVDGVDTLNVVDIISSYDVKYLHVDATKIGVMSADYDAIRTISKNTNLHLIGNNSVTSHEDYLKMLEFGADSVSVARATLDGNIDKIFNP